jgi:hypothetical protein
VKERVIYIYVCILYKNNEEKGKKLSLTLKINAQLLHQLLGQLAGKGKRGCKMSKTALTL